MFNSLNYVSGDAKNDPLEVSRGSGHVFSGPFAFLNPVRAWNLHEGPEDRTRLRAFLNSALVSEYPGIAWIPKTWLFAGVYKQDAVEVYMIPELTSRGPGRDPRRRRQNFFNCYKQKSRGKIYPARNGELYYSRKHCGEPACLLCNQWMRARLAQEHILLRKQTIESHPEGFRGFLSLGFTLPKSVEALPFKDGKIEQKLLDLEQQIVREIFGVMTADEKRKIRARIKHLKRHPDQNRDRIEKLKGKLRGALSQRANIAMTTTVHPIGSRDIFRDRWHSHVDVIPAIIENREFRWIEPVLIATDKGHKPERWRLDLRLLREKWASGVSEIFGRPLQVNQPEVSFIPSPANTSYWANRLKPDQSPLDGFWSKVGHQLNYNLRSFSEDFENAVLRTDVEGKRFAVKARDANWEWWAVVDVRYFVERFKWVREHNRISTRGWAQCANKYSDVLGLAKEDIGPVPEVDDPIPAEVTLIRQKDFDSKRKDVVWKRDEIYRFRCPFSGQDKSLSVKDMKPWVWPDRSIPDGEIEDPVPPPSIDPEVWDSVCRSLQKTPPDQGGLFGGNNRGPPGGRRVKI